MAQTSSSTGSGNPQCLSEFISNFARSLSQVTIIPEERPLYEGNGTSLFIAENATKGLRVAVLREVEEPCNPSYDGLVREFVEIALTGFAVVLDRSLFQEVLEEQMKSLSGIIADDTLVEVGESIGAEGFVSCKVVCLETGIYCSVKCVKTETTEILWSILCPFEDLATNMEKLKTHLN